MGDPKSHVTAHFDGKKLTANIQTDNDTFVIEPMWRHLPKSQPGSPENVEHGKEDMVMYRRSDVNLLDYEDPHSQEGFCNTKELMRSLREKQHKQVKAF